MTRRWGITVKGLVSLGVERHLGPYYSEEAFEKTEGQWICHLIDCGAISSGSDWVDFPPAGFTNNLPPNTRKALRREE